MRDEFLSEEDLALAELSPAELESWWMAWLQAAQVTNELDADSYSHGVFMLLDGSVRAAGLPTEP